MALPSIRNILRGNQLVRKEVQALKSKIIEQNDKMAQLTSKIEANKAKNEVEVKRDWRHVPEPTEEDQYPLAEADLTKLLNIL